jgi:RNA polymerase sigma factor (sigma-70 family)
MINFAALSDEDLLTMYYTEEDEQRADLAFTALERRYFPRLLLSLTIPGYNKKFVKLYNKPGLENKAEELVAEALLRVAESRARPSARWKRDRQRVSPWIHGILRNTVISYLRKKQPELLTGVDTKDEDEDCPASPLAATPSDDPEPDEVLQNQALLGHLRDCLEKLPEQHRLICEMIFQQGLKQSEVALKLKLSAPTLSRRKQDAFEMLRECLRGKGVGEGLLG